MHFLTLHHRRVVVVVCCVKICKDKELIKRVSQIAEAIRKS